MTDDLTLDQERPAVDPREVFHPDRRQRQGACPGDDRKPGKVGYRCTVATSGPEGVAQIEQANFQVVITDLVMNDVDGMQCCKRPSSRCPTARSSW